MEAKQRKRAARKARRAAERESKRESLPEDDAYDEDAGAEFFLGEAEAAGMRTVTHEVMKQLATVVNDENIETAEQLHAGMAAVLVKAKVEDAVKEAQKFSDHLVSLGVLSFPTNKSLAREERNEMVMAMKTWSKSNVMGQRVTKAPRQKAGEGAGHQAGGQRSSASLGMELSKSTRKPKPRALSEIDEILWSESRKTAEEELQKQFQIKQSLEDYYLTMCSVGQILLANEVHSKTQRIYDNRATKKFQRNKN